MRANFKTLEDLLREMDGLDIDELLFLSDYNLNIEALHIISNSLGSRMLNRRYWSTVKERNKLGFNFEHSSFRKTSGYSFT